MKKSNILAFATAGILSMLTVSCKKTESVSSQTSFSKLNVNGKTAAIGAWSRVFIDDFTTSSSLNNWSAASRTDYNSSICKYESFVPAVANYDNRDVLVLTATKVGSTYQSGLVKTKTFAFKPGINEEYRTSASIKLIALDGSTWRDFNQTYGAWPAFWTVQENAWPTQGEIDIMEGYTFGTYNRYASNLFYGTTSNQNQLGNTCEKQYTVGTGWHMYDEYWKNENGWVTVTIQLDGVTVSTYTNNINGNLKLQNFGPHNIIFNLNVGSNSNVGIFDNSRINLFSKSMMWVDYVTVDRRTL